MANKQYLALPANVDGDGGEIILLPPVIRKAREFIRRPYIIGGCRCGFRDQEPIEEDEVSTNEAKAVLQEHHLATTPGCTEKLNFECC